MSWSPITLYYKNAITSLTALEQADYPASNMLDRVEGTKWKAPQKNSYGITPVNTFVADYLLIYGHNLAGWMLGLIKTSFNDYFNNSSLDAKWSTSVAGSGTVVETSSLAITTPAANDAALLIETAAFVKTDKRRVLLQGTLSAVTNGFTFLGLAYRSTVGTSAAWVADILCRIVQTSTGEFRVSYNDTGGVLKYYNAATGLWDTTSTNNLYAGAVATSYMVELITDGTRWRFLLRASTGATLAVTPWVAFSSCLASGSGALHAYCGDPYNDANTATFIAGLGGLQEAEFIIDVPDNKPILKTFASQTYNCIPVVIAPVAPADVATIAGLQIGEATVLDHADAVTPYDLENKAVVNVGDTGVLQGIHDKYTEHALTIKFMDADTALTDKLIAWEAAVGLGLFGIRWDPGDHSTDIRMMRRKDGKFTAPLKVGGTYADLTMNLIGRKE